MDQGFGQTSVCSQYVYRRMGVYVVIVFFSGSLFIVDLGSQGSFFGGGGISLGIWQMVEILNRKNKQEQYFSGGIGVRSFREMVLDMW